MNTTLILGGILLVIVLYGLLYILFPSKEFSYQIDLDKGEVIDGFNITEVENTQVANFTHCFFLYLREAPFMSSASKHNLVKRSGIGGFPIFEIYMTKGSTKLIVTNSNINATSSSPTASEVNGAEITRLPLQKHVHVCVVVRESSIDIYLDGKLVNSSSFENKMLVAYYDQAITLGDDANFTASDNLSAGYMHSYQYIDRAITADELSIIYNSLMTSYSKVDKNSYSAKIYLTRDGNEIGGLSQRFTL